MRDYGWKIAVIAIVACYPVANVIGRLVTYIGMKTQDQPTPAQQLQMIKLGNVFFVGTAILLWTVALISSMEASRVEDDLERRLGRFSLYLVLFATVTFAAVYGLGRLVKGIALV